MRQKCFTGCDEGKAHDLSIRMIYRFPICILHTKFCGIKVAMCLLSITVNFPISTDDLLKCFNLFSHRSYNVQLLTNAAFAWKLLLLNLLVDATSRPIEETKLRRSRLTSVSIPNFQPSHCISMRKRIKSISESMEASTTWMSVFITIVSIYTNCLEE